VHPGDPQMRELADDFKANRWPSRHETPTANEKDAKFVIEAMKPELPPLKARGCRRSSASRGSDARHHRPGG